MLHVVASPGPLQPFPQEEWRSSPQTTWRGGWCHLSGAVQKGRARAERGLSLHLLELLGGVPGAPDIRVPTVASPKAPLLALPSHSVHPHLLGKN